MRRCEMKFNGLSQFKLLVCTALLASFSGTAQALIPVTDPGTLAQTIENNINLGLEFKEVKKVVELAGTMNTTIGDSIKSFHEYVDTYNQYKDTINGALDTAGKYAGSVAGGGSGATAAGGGTGGVGMTSSLTGPGTNKGYAVLPNELADYCGISASDIDEVAKKGVVVNCLKKLITYRNSKTLEDQRSARDIYVKAFHETAYANVAEAVVMRNYAVNYEREVLKPLSEKLKKAKTVRDDYSGVVMVNKEVANMLNRILMVYASKVSYDALRDYGDFEIYPDDLLQLD